MPLEFDLIQNATVAAVEVGTVRLAPWATMSRDRWEADMLQRGRMVQTNPVGTTRIYIFIQPDDLPPEPPYRPIQHSYWPPTSVAKSGWGRIQILRVPKIEINFPRGVIAGAPMAVRYWFWTDRDKMNQLTSNASMETWQSYATMIVKTIEPIPMNMEWKVPVWQPLPATLPRNPMMLTRVLMTRTIGGN